MPPPLPLSYVGVLSLTRCLSDCLVACCLSLTHFVLSPSTSLLLSLSLIVRLTHTISSSDSLSHPPSLFHTRSLPLSLTRFLSHTLITASFPLSLSFSKLLTRCYSLSFTRWLPASLPLAFTSLSHSPTRCFSLISYLSPTRCLSHTVSSSLSYLSAISQPALSLRSPSHYSSRCSGERLSSCTHCRCGHSNESKRANRCVGCTHAALLCTDLLIFGSMLQSERKK